MHRTHHFLNFLKIDFGYGTFGYPQVAMV